MFKRKYRAVLISENGDYVRRVDYTVEGGLRIRLTTTGDIILNDGGSIFGNTLFSRWVPLS